MELSRVGRGSKFWCSEWWLFLGAVAAHGPLSRVTNYSVGQRPLTNSMNSCSWLQHRQPPNSRAVLPTAVEFVFFGILVRGPGGLYRGYLGSTSEN
jgi:hypothetical protein